jgi:glycosyltransferase involved in cell wall biosynthesis
VKLLFVHGGPLFRDEYGNYYGNSFNNDYFERFKSIAEDIIVATRIKEVKKSFAQEKLSKITVESLDVIQCANIASAKGIITNYNKVKVALKSVIINVDYVVVRVPSSYGYIAASIANKLGKQCLVEVVGCAWDATWNHSFIGKIYAPIAYTKMLLCTKNAQYLSYVSKEFLQKRYKSKGKSISCSDVNLKDVNRKLLDKRIMKIERTKANNSIVLGTVAGLNVRYKGQRYVIRAISELNRQGFNFEYKLVGGGDPTYLKKIANNYGVIDKIHFLGTLPHEEIFTFMEDIDIYIQPSDAESHGRVIIEAFSTACPVIGSSTGGIPELVDKEYVFKRKSVKDLKRVLVNIIDSNLKEIAERNFEKSKEFKKCKLDNIRRKFYNDFSLGRGSD